MTTNYTIEEPGEYDDGTMPNNVATLGDAVIGHKIVKVEQGVPLPKSWYSHADTCTKITLDNGKAVLLGDSDDCCAYTELEAFLLHPDKVDHIITGVGTEGDFHTWHIFADAGDVLALTVNWSCGNPFYYGYGFNIAVVDTKEN